MSSAADFDVIVVGAGGSGLAAAVSAAEQGASVLVLERFPEPGGTTGIAVGSFTAAETQLQRRNQIADRVEDHAVDAGKFAPPLIEERNNESLRSYFLGQAADTLEWLRGMGLSFVGPHPEPPNRTPRMHNVVPCAKAYIATLELQLLKLNGTLRCNQQVTALRQDRVGRVTGVDVLGPNGEEQINARRGVVLACGDYANNSKMLSRFKGDEFSQIEGINSRALGDGHLLVESVGGALINMDVTYGPELRFVPSSRKPFQQWLPRTGWLAKVQGAISQRMPKWILHRMIKRLLVTWQHPEDSLFKDGAILVNGDGERFVDETKWPQREQAVAAQPDREAYLVLDQRLCQRYSKWPHFVSTAPDIAYAYVQDYERLRRDITRKGKLHELLPKFAKLEQTIREFNEYILGSRRDPYSRSGDQTCFDLDGELVILGPVRAYFTTTEGGAEITEQLEVLDESGAPIPGLYAVGQNGLGGMILWGHGLHIAWAMTSGRLVGQQIMRGDARNGSAGR